MSASDRPPHVDPEALALMALGEDTDARIRDHLAGCPECQDELEELRATVAVGRAGLGDERLAEPAPRVWSAIADELGLDRDVSPTTTTPASASGPPDVVPRRRIGRRAAVAVIATTLAAAGVVTAVVVAVQATRPTVVASAALEPLPDWLGAEGEAVVEESPDGARDVRVTLDASDGDGYREVWLLTRDATALVSLGVLDGSTGRFTIPADVDLGEYPIIDVSQEPADGDPTHSGDSIVRGLLG
ncbi:anti-sigma factor [Herbiconiux sp. L3-i23]|uniref:anti-sigma factor n=1 Tax=Herbiconiux sp. L3-i23 TaxID=2905871 RepID=UPI00206FAD2E|nr:anti-sigma factor [Herbiconiux sp. L3-i23]BDI23190.1 hypothetical protein L3i23_19660 [Herbiconiux sp. L3-i23]